MQDKELILEKAKVWFRETIASKHIENTEKLVDPNKFHINPFTVVYLANFLTGNSSPESIARALLLPRVLGTSISTSFGTGVQKFTNDVLDAYSSTTSGIDIEFIDQIDGTRKYCQLKAGPNTINKDDVETIAGHFRSVINLAKTNNLRIPFEDMTVGVIYGEQNQMNSHYRRITNQYYYPVMVGSDFWHRLTGDENFYEELIQAIGSVAIESDYCSEFEEIVRKLAQTSAIRSLSK